MFYISPKLKMNQSNESRYWLSSSWYRGLFLWRRFRNTAGELQEGNNYAKIHITIKGLPMVGDLYVF